MTKLQKAIQLYKHIQTIDLKHPNYEKMLKDLGWKDEMSWQQLRTMFVHLRDIENSTVSYCQEILILKELSKPRWETYHWEAIILDATHHEVSRRTIRRYIKEIRASNIKICTKKGAMGGYFLEKPLDF